MSDPNCERWALISDQRLLGDEISDDEAEFAREHAAECPYCGAEARVYDDLDASDELAETSAAAIVEEVLAKKLPLKSEPHPGHVVSLEEARKRNRSSYLAGAMGTALALAAGVALMLGGIGERVPAQRIGALESATGDVRVNGAPVEAGAIVSLGARIDVASGRACLAFDGNPARSCLDSESTLVVEKVTPTERVLSLAKGTVVSALEKLPAGHHFVVTSYGAKASVTGTVFSVTAKERTRVIVRVHEGSVKTEAPTVSRAVVKNHELDIAKNQLTQVDLGVRDHELELVGMRLARVEAAATPPTLRNTALPVPAPSEPAPTEPVVQVPSASDMLATARKLRAAGNSTGAAEAYRKLMLAHPRSREANAALLSLAELQLGPLGDPSGALRSYDGYLRSGGGLSQEARYGRILALRRLGRAAEERAAIEQFVQSYPSSVQARALKSRLEAPSKP